MWLLPVFLVGWAVAYWLILCVASWTADQVFEFYPGQRRRRAERRPATPSPKRLDRPVTLCGCNSCMARRREP